MRHVKREIMSAIYTRKGYRYRSNLGVLPNSKYFFPSAIQVLFCLVFVQSTMRTSLLVIQDFARDNSIGFFRLNLCQVLLLFRAVQVKQLALLASFLFDLFRRLATLSCRVLIVTWLWLDCAANPGAQHGKGGNSQWFHSGQTHVGSPANQAWYFFHCYAWWSEAISIRIFLLGLYDYSALLRMASTSRSTIIAATGHGDGSGSNFYHSVH